MLTNRIVPVRFATVAMFAVVFSPLWAQSPTAKVSLSMAATRVPQALEAICKQTGMSLVTVPAFENEPIIIHCKDQPVRDVLERIAEATGGTWVQEGSTLRLTRSSQTANDERGKTRALWAQEFSTARAEVAKRLAEFGKMDEARAKSEAEKAMKQRNDFIERVNSNTAMTMSLAHVPTTAPADLALWRMIGAFDPNRIAEIEPGSRVVFAVTPTSMQKPLPSGSSAIIREFVVEHNHYAKAVSSLPKTPTEDDIHIMSNGTQAQPLTGNPAEVLVIVHRDESGNYEFGLQVADSKGKIVASSDQFVNVTPTVTPWRTDGWGTKTLAFSEKAQQHARLLMHQPTRAFSGVMVRSFGSTESVAVMVSGVPIGGAPAETAPSRPEVTTNWRNILANPLQYDPLSFGVSEAFQGIGVAAEKPIIAVLPDEALIPTLPLVLETRPIQQWATALAGLCNLSDSEGWLVVTPSKSFVSRNARLNRKSFQALANSTVKQNRVDLDSLTQFALKVPSGYSPTAAAERTLDLLVEGTAGAFSDVINENLDLGKFYALLGANRRNSMTPEGSIRMMMLGPNEMAVLRNLVFNSYGGTQVDKRNPNEQGNTMTRSFAFSSSNGMRFRTFSEDLIDERTEHLPNGIPNGGEFMFRVQQQDAALALPSNGGPGRFMSATELGMTLGFAEQNAGLLTTNNGLADYKSFQIGQRFDFELRWNLADRISMTRYLNDEAVLAGTKPGTYEALPGDFRAKVDEAKKNHRIQMNRPPAPPRR